MGIVTVQKHTTMNPISLIGEEAGICWGADITDEAKNYKRGVDCIKANHGRTMEYPSIYLVISGYSSKVIREFYTHVVGNSRLQSSTRYIDYSNCFENVTPKSVENNPEAKEVWDKFMSTIPDTIDALKKAGVPNEDATNILPLAYTTKIVVKMNIRSLMNMAEMRLCSRAYWEYRELMSDILTELAKYSDEWEDIIYDLKVFVPKCEKAGFCVESKCCGRKPRKNIGEGSSKCSST